MPQTKPAMKKSKRTIRVYKIVRFLALIILCYFFVVKISSMLNIKQPIHSPEIDYTAAEENYVEAASPPISDFEINFSNLLGWNQAPPENLSLTAPKNYTTLRSKILKYLKSQSGKYGIYMISLTSGQQMGINENRGFFGASTIKIPINLYLYNVAAIDGISLDEELEYLEEDYEEGTGSIQSEELGTLYALRELSRRSIVESDNVATNMILRHIGLENVKAHMKQLGGRYYKYDRNVSSPKDMAIYMKAVYDFSNYYRDLGSELLDNFKNTEYNDRIPALLPDGIEVAHKIGSWPGTINDVGIIYGRNPFVLAIMSEDADEEAAPIVIAKIAKMVYDFEQKD